MTIAIHSPNGCTIDLSMEDGHHWKLYRNLKYKKTDKSDLSAMNQRVAEMRSILDSDSNQSLPAIIHYGINK